MTRITDTSSFALLAHEAGFGPIEERLQMNVRATIEAMFEEELAGFLGRLRYGRGTGPTKGYRYGHRERQLTGTFGTETVRVPRARIEPDLGRVREPKPVVLQLLAWMQVPGPTGEERVLRFSQAKYIKENKKISLK